MTGGQAERESKGEPGTAHLDDTDRVLREADRVLASIHDTLNRSGEKIDAAIKVLRRAGYLR
ncbi:MAG TPA: hypothetical protein VHB02_11850 [Acidimicrobiales bacterium]|nr:hypothetical protein [Acidimicrobiales bacterium]